MVKSTLHLQGMEQQLPACLKIWMICDIRLIRKGGRIQIQRWKGTSFHHTYPLVFKRGNGKWMKMDEHGPILNDVPMQTSIQFGFSSQQPPMFDYQQPASRDSGAENQWENPRPRSTIPRPPAKSKPPLPVAMMFPGQAQEGAAIHAVFFFDRII